jgi:hypothetical protein
MEAIGALILVGAFLAGFLIVSKWVDNIVAQLFLGAIMGAILMIGVVCVIFGVMFAGCLLTNAKMDFR